jgi:hypothetical protein
MVMSDFGIAADQSYDDSPTTDFYDNAARIVSERDVAAVGNNGEQRRKP